ncbi:MAG: hypothetical protein ACOCX3_02875 [Chloroflexota bacterium]
MFAQTINLLPFVTLNKRVLLVLAILAIVALTLALFVLSPEVALAGPAPSSSACAACNT